jgi:hypothetical protein
MVGGPATAAIVGGGVATADTVDAVDRRLREQHPEADPNQTFRTAENVGALAAPAAGAASAFTGVGGNIVKKIGADMLVGAGQDLAIQGADYAVTGQPVDPRQLAESAAGAGVVSGVMRGAHKAVEVVAGGKPETAAGTPENQQGFARFAQQYEQARAAAAKPAPHDLPPGFELEGPNATQREAANGDVGTRPAAQERAVARGGGEPGAAGAGGGGAAVAGDVRPVGEGVGPVVGETGAKARHQPGDVDGARPDAAGVGNRGGGVADADQQAFQRFIQERDQRQFREWLAGQNGEGSPAADAPFDPNTATLAERQAHKIGKNGIELDEETRANMSEKAMAAYEKGAAERAPKATDGLTAKVDAALPETPVDHLSGPIAVDKGTLKEPGQRRSYLDRLSDAGDSAMERIRKRNSGAMPKSGLDPRDAADFAIVGAGLFAKGVRGLKAYTEQMATMIGEHVRPHAAALFKQSRDIFLKERSADEVYERAAAQQLKGETVPRSESPLESVRRTTGQYRPQAVRGEMARLRLQIQTLARGAAQGFKAGVEETMKLKTALARTLSENLPPEHTGALLADVARATTLGDVRRALHKASGVLADAELDAKLGKVEQIAGKLKLDPVQGPKNRPAPDPVAGADVTLPPGPKPLDPTKTPLKDVRKLDPAVREEVRQLMSQARIIKAKAGRGMYKTTDAKVAATAELDRIAGEMGRIVHESNHATSVQVMGKVMELR